MNYQGKLTVLAGCVALLVGAAHAQSPAPHLKFSQLFSKMRRSRETA